MLFGIYIQYVAVSPRVARSFSFISPLPINYILYTKDKSTRVIPLQEKDRLLIIFDVKHFDEGPEITVHFFLANKHHFR